MDVAQINFNICIFCSTMWICINVIRFLENLKTVTWLPSELSSISSDISVYEGLNEKMATTITRSIHQVFTIKISILRLTLAWLNSPLKTIKTFGIALCYRIAKINSSCKFFIPRKRGSVARWSLFKHFFSHFNYQFDQKIEKWDEKVLT